MISLRDTYNNLDKYESEYEQLFQKNEIEANKIVNEALETNATELSRQIKFNVLKGKQELYFSYECPKFDFFNDKQKQIEYRNQTDKYFKKEIENAGFEVIKIETFIGSTHLIISWKKRKQKEKVPTANVVDERGYTGGVTFESKDSHLIYENKKPTEKCNIL